MDKKHHFSQVLDKNQVPEKVIESKSDVVVFLGAGDIYKITKDVVRKFKKNLKVYRYLFFIVCIALISALFFLNINNKSRVIEIGNIRIDKNPYKIISGDSVNKMLKLEINSNKIKFKRDLNLKEIENKLNQNSLIEDFQIFVTIKGEVRTIVKPKMPILSVHGLEKYFLDKHGKQFPISIDKNYSKIPLVFGKFKSQEHYDLVNAINKIYKDKFMLNHIKNFFLQMTDYFLKLFLIIMM